MRTWFRTKEERFTQKLLECLQATLDSISEVHLGKKRLYYVCKPFAFEFYILDRNSDWAIKISIDVANYFLRQGPRIFYNHIEWLVTHTPTPTPTSNRTHPGRAKRITPTTSAPNIRIIH